MHKRCYLVVWKKHWFDWVWRSTTSAAPRRGDCMAKAMKPAMARHSKACWSATSPSKKSSKIKAFQGITPTRVVLFFMSLCHNIPALAYFSPLLYAISMSRQYLSVADKTVAPQRLWWSGSLICSFLLLLVLKTSRIHLCNIDTPGSPGVFYLHLSLTEKSCEIL